MTGNDLAARPDAVADDSSEVEDVIAVVDAARDSLPDVAPNPRHRWSRGFGGSVMTADSDKTGAVVFAGMLWNEADFGGGVLRTAGKDDIFLAKLDASGKHVFSKRFGDGETQATGRLALDGAGNIVLTGSTEGRIDLGGGAFGPTGEKLYERQSFIARFASDGTPLWSKPLTTVDRANAVDVTTSGEILFGGFASGPGGGLPLTGLGAFIARLGPDGTVRFARTLGAAEVHAVALDEAGNMYVGGDLEGVTDFGDGPIAPTRKYEGFLAKLDPSGKLAWFYRAKGTGTDATYSIAVAPSGDVMYGGEFDGTLDFGAGPVTRAASSGITVDAFVVALDRNGMHRWSRTFGGEGNEDTFALAIDREDQVYVGGLFSSKRVDVGGGVLEGRGSTDGFLIALDRNGKYRYSYAFGSGDLDSLLAIAIGGDDLLTIAGWNSSPVDLGGGPLSPLGSYVGKLAR